MRSVLSLVVLGVVSLSLFTACGDASDSAGNQRAPIIIGSDGDPEIGDKDPSTPNASNGVAPPPPASAGESTGSVGAALTDATPLVDLGATMTDTVTLTAMNGFTGAVNLTVEGLPTGVTATFDTPTVNMTTGTATAKITYKVDPTAALSSKPSAITVKATAGAATATANANFKVNPQITFHIPVNMAALQKAGTLSDLWAGAAFGATPTVLQIPSDVAGVTVIVHNDDSSSHIFHTEGGSMFPHGDTANPIPAASFEVDPTDATKNRTRTLLAGLNHSGYSHDLNSGGGYQIKTAAAP